MTTSEILMILTAVFCGLVTLSFVVTAVAAMKLNGKIERLTVDLGTRMQSLQEETTVTLQQAHDTLARVEMLSKSVDTLVKDELTPVLHLVRATAEHAEATARAVRGSAEGAQKVIGAVEGVATPASAAAMAGKIIGTPGGRMSAAVVVGGALLKALLASRAHGARKSAEPEAAE